jgi:ubiquinone/menaquinone biosynthesis C-methylase UbiE
MGVRSSAVGRLLVRTAVGRCALDTARNFVVARRWQRRARLAEARLGIRYRLPGGGFPLTVGSPPDVRLVAHFPDGRRLPLRVTEERGYEDLDGRQHLPMYQTFVERLRRRADLRVLPGDLVVDCACGSGYGAAFLHAALGARVVAVDIDPVAVRYAQRRYPSDANGPSFLTADGASALAAGSARAIVSIETIEHVTDPGAMIAEFARALRPGGLHFITSPDATDRPGTRTSVYHQTEFTEGEFIALLEEDFVVADLLRQPPYLVALAQKPEGPASRRQRGTIPWRPHSHGGA